MFIFVGLAFLMTYMYKYGFSSIGYSLLVGSLAIEFGIIANSFWLNLWSGYLGEDKNVLDMKGLIGGEYSAMVMLITLGAVIGKTSPL